MSCFRCHWRQVDVTEIEEGSVSLHGHIAEDMLATLMTSDAKRHKHKVSA